MKRLTRVLLYTSLIITPVLPAFAQGTAFTYQGRLNNGSTPATGSYDLTFTLFNTNSTGVALAGPMTNAATAVNNGLFTATLDLGNQFPGANRWLEIAVRTNVAGAFATLAPRQPLTPTPYAIFANTASNLSGTITTAQLPGTIVVNYGTASGAAATALGTNTVASGAMALAAGSSTLASGFGAVAMGVNTKATNYAATALGSSTTASGSTATALGNNTTASGMVSTALGAYTTASGSVSTALGQNTTASGPNSTAMGAYTTAGGNYSTAMGYYTTASGNYSTALGAMAQATNAGTFVWSDASDFYSYFPSTSSNQFLVRANGGVGINTNNPNGNALSVSGNTYVNGVITANGNLRMDTTGGAYSEGLALNCPADMGGYGGLMFYNAPRGGTLGASTIKWDVAYNYAPELGVAGGGLAFVRNNTTTSMYLGTTGNVGIGTTSPQATLQVASSGGFTSPQLLLSQLNTGDYARLQIGVNTFPQWTLAVSPGATPVLNFWNGSANVAYLNYNGALYAQSFNPTSDRNAKENFKSVSPREVLDKVAALPISEWNFKTAPGEAHIGPMAQDFHAAFGTGSDDKHIATVDADGVALAAIQGLNQKVEETRAENAELKRELSELKNLVQQLGHNQQPLKP